MNSDEPESQEQFSSMDRRKFLKASFGSAAATIGLAVLGEEAFAESETKYKAAYSAVGSEVFWVKKGIDTFRHLGDLVGFEFYIYDARLSVSR